MRLGVPGVSVGFEKSPWDRLDMDPDSLNPGTTREATIKAPALVLTGVLVLISFDLAS